MGWYGAQGDDPLTEESRPCEDFSHILCEVWEAAALKAVQHGVPVVLLRTGIVLDARGGMLRCMLPPFRMGLGGRLGDGRQVLSWISLADWVEAVRLLLRLHLHGAASAPVGPFNLSAPKPGSNADFTRTLGRVLGRPTVLAVPAPVLKVLLGEMSTLLLDGQRVLPRRLQGAGFPFRQPRLQGCLETTLRRAA